MTILHKFLSVFVISSCLIGCNRYDVKINENTVYSPKKLFTNYSIEDRGLNDCVQQTIIEDNVRSKKQASAIVLPKCKN